MESPNIETEPRPPLSRSPARSSKLLRILVTMGILGGAVAIFLSHPAGTATGDVRSTGKPDGDFVVRPVTCFDGGHWGFSGVWVVPETESSGNRRGFKGGLKIVKTHANELEVYLENPQRCQVFQCEQRKVERRHCRLFDVAVGRGRLPLRQDGHARMDCAFPEGGTLRAELDFNGCARVSSQSAEP